MSRIGHFVLKFLTVLRLMTVKKRTRQRRVDNRTYYYIWRLIYKEGVYFG